MRQLRDDTHLILDGEVRVYRRERSKRWQAAFVIDGHTIRISTGKRDLAEAKEYARDTFLEYKFRHKNDLPVVTKKFSDVAKLAATKPFSEKGKRSRNRRSDTAACNIKNKPHNQSHK